MSMQDTQLRVGYSIGQWKNEQLKESALTPVCDIFLLYRYKIKQFK
jgi:hypothetical protein